MTKIAAIRIRGTMGLSNDKRDTLNMLRLFNKNYCVVLENNSNYIGMLTKAKDYITWGEINEEIFSLLLKERGRIAGNKRFMENYLKEKKFDIDNFVKDFFSNKKSLKDIPGLKSLLV